MEENKVTAQTSEDIADDVSAVDVVEDEEDDPETSFTDTDDEDGDDEGDDENEDGKKPAQSKEENSEFARKRREAERRKELKDLRYKTIIEALGGKNPYTGGEMKDDADVDEFLTMQEISKKGGDPINDFAKHHKETAREQAKKAEEEHVNREWYRNDLEAFQKKYPDVKINDLIADEDFADYADGKIGKKPLAEIYEKYLSRFGKKDAGTQKQSATDPEHKARAMAAQMVANKKASVGALNTPGTAEEQFFTKEDVDKMSVAECEKNYDKIIKSMSHWK